LKIDFGLLQSELTRYLEGHQSSCFLLKVLDYDA